jgi:hypothetical protein
MKKAILLFTLLFTIFVLVPTVNASDKPTILVLLSGSLNKPESWDRNQYKNATKSLQKTFANYNLLIGDQYKKQLEDNGTPDAGSMERSDLISIFKDANPDFIIIYEFLPYGNGVGSSRPSGSTATVHLKIIDTAKNIYAFNKQFSYRSTWASLDGRYSKIYSDIENEAFGKCFPLAVITTANNK